MGPLVKTANDMAWFYNIHWHEAPRYSVGDKVWLSSENIRMTRPTKKLDYKWLSPYTITGLSPVMHTSSNYPRLLAKSTPSSLSHCYAPMMMTLSLNVRNTTRCCCLQLSVMVSKNMKSKRFSTIGYSVALWEGQIPSALERLWG